MAETWTLEVTPGLLERGVAIERRLGHRLEFHESPGITQARRLMCLSDFDGARPLLADAEDRAKASGDEGTRAHVLFHRFQVEWFTGHWAEADELATAALELADQLRDEQYRAIALYARALSRRPLRPSRGGTRGRYRVPGDRRGSVRLPVRSPESHRARVPRAVSRGRRRGGS